MQELKREVLADLQNIYVAAGAMMDMDTPLDRENKCQTIEQMCQSICKKLNIPGFGNQVGGNA